MYRRKKQNANTPKATSNRLLVPVNLDVETDGARDDGAADTIDLTKVEGVGVDHTGGVAADRRALVAVVVADLHALDVNTGSLGLDGGNIPARPAVVAGVAKVEFTPGAGVAAELVNRQVLTLGGTPGALGVVVESNVLDLTGVEGELEGGVAVPAGQLAIRADLVPEDHGPGVSVAAVDADDVLVLMGLVGFDLDDVAAPGVTNVALVEDDVAAAGVAALQRLLTEAFAGEFAVLGDLEPAIVGAVAVAGDGGTRGLDGGGGRDGSDSGMGRLGGSRASVGGSGSGVGLASPLIYPGDQLAVDGGVDHIAGTTLIDSLSLAAGMVVEMAAFVAMKTGSGRASGQSSEEKEGVLELHF